jgi:hypothetical protein
MSKMSKKPGIRRAIDGLRTGAMWGILCGVLVGVWRIFEVKYSWPWYLDFAGGVVGFVIGSALVSAIGKAIANSVSGAMYGAAVGLILAIRASVWTVGWAVDLLGAQHWGVVALGISLAIFPCALGGATIGALIQRWKQTN